MKPAVVIAAILTSTLVAGAATAQLARSEAVKVYAAAVAKDPLNAIAADYEKSTGNKVTLVFDTAGATEQRFRADPDASLLITTAPLIKKSQDSGALKGGMTIALGSTVAGVAVTPGSAKPDVSTPDKLKAALLNAKHIAVSDPARGATVGTHFMKVVEALGIKDEVMRKITFAPDGLATMRLVLDGKADLGVSQSSEIQQASPAAMVGPFPQQFALSTDFSLWHPEKLSPAASAFLARLTGASGRERLVEGGIIPAH